MSEYDDWPRSELVERIADLEAAVTNGRAMRDEAIRQRDEAMAIVELARAWASTKRRWRASEVRGLDEQTAEGLHLLCAESNAADALAAALAPPEGEA